MRQHPYDNLSLKSGLENSRITGPGPQWVFRQRNYFERNFHTDAEIYSLQKGNNK
jgi:hypothetical protein